MNIYFDEDKCDCDWLPMEGKHENWCAGWKDLVKRKTERQQILEGSIADGSDLGVSKMQRNMAVAAFIGFWIGVGMTLLMQQLAAATA